MHCPRDESQLVVYTKGQLHIEQCSECNGFFVNLTQQAANQLSSLLKRDISADVRNPRHGLKSPQSGEIMQCFIYRGVQLDYGEKSHSVWFDQGEYTKIFASPQPPRNLGASEGSQRSDSIDKAADLADKAETSVGVLGFVGDLVGDLISGIDIF